MQIPIAYALNYPNRLANNIEKIDLFEISSLSFEKPDLEKFQCLKLAFEAIEKGHSYQVVLNAANEVLVDAFLNHKILYTDIPKGIKTMLDNHSFVELNTVEEILALDKEVKEKTRELIGA